MPMQTRESSNRAAVLLAEDDENDVLLLRHAFRRAGLQYPIIDVPNGEEVINYLSGCVPFEDRDHHPLPALLLLDLKMPLVNGFDVLSWLQARPEYHDLPAVVLSSSGLDPDRRRAHDLGARDYLVKPLTSDDMVRLVQQLSLRWLAGVKLSSAPQAGSEHISIRNALPRGEVAH